MDRPWVVEYHSGNGRWGELCACKTKSAARVILVRLRKYDHHFKKYDYGTRIRNVETGEIVEVK